jgi:hypothetical protein
LRNCCLQRAESWPKWMCSSGGSGVLWCLRCLRCFLLLSVA